MPQILIIGFGGIGAALAAYYAAQGYSVTVASRHAPSETTYRWHQWDEQRLHTDMPWLTDMLQQGPCWVFCTLGLLHNEQIQPEKSIRQLQPDMLTRVMHENVTLPSLWLQQLSRAMDRRHRHKVLVLSAKVGSISDNQLGGWYSYRASKAALNMLVKCCAIEWQRSGYKSLVATVHPGTTDTRLSAPFQRGLAPGQLQTPAHTAARLATVMAECIQTQHGCLLNWDGQVLAF